MNKIHWLLIVAMFLLGVGFLLTAIFAPVAAGVGTGLIAALVSSNAIVGYSVIHFVASALHLYAIKKRSGLLRLALTIELFCALFVTILLLLVSGFVSPLWVYTAFLAAVISITRD